MSDDLDEYNNSASSTDSGDSENSLDSINAQWGTDHKFTLTYQLDLNLNNLMCTIKHLPAVSVPIDIFNDLLDYSNAQFFGTNKYLKLDNFKNELSLNLQQFTSSFFASWYNMEELFWPLDLATIKHPVTGLKIIDVGNKIRQTLLSDIDLVPNIVKRHDPIENRNIPARLEFNIQLPPIIEKFTYTCDRNIDELLEFLKSSLLPKTPEAWDNRVNRIEFINDESTFNILMAEDAIEAAERYSSCLIALLNGEYAINSLKLDIQILKDALKQPE